MKNLRSRLNDLPMLRSDTTTVAAERYNRVRLALRRLSPPLRIELPGLRSLEMIIENDVWAIIDRDTNDLPVAAWTDFAPRSALHQPVTCIVRFYHAHANAVIDKAWQAADQILAKRLVKC